MHDGPLVVEPGYVPEMRDLHRSASLGSGSTLASLATSVLMASDELVRLLSVVVNGDVTGLVIECLGRPPSGPSWLQPDETACALEWRRTIRVGPVGIEQGSSVSVVVRDVQGRLRYRPVDFTPTYELAGLPLVSLERVEMSFVTRDGFVHRRELPGSPPSLLDLLAGFIGGLLLYGSVERRDGIAAALDRRTSK